MKTAKKYEGRNPDRDVQDRVKWFWPKKLKNKEIINTAAHEINTCITNDFLSKTWNIKTKYTFFLQEHKVSRKRSYILNHILKSENVLIPLKNVCNKKW